MKLTTHLHLVPRLRLSHVFMLCTRANLPFTSTLVINLKTRPIHYTRDNRINKACSFLQNEKSLEKLHVDHSALQELVYSCTLGTYIYVEMHWSASHKSIKGLKP